MGTAKRCPRSRYNDLAARVRVLRHCKGIHWDAERSHGDMLDNIEEALASTETTASCCIKTFTML